MSDPTDLHPLGTSAQTRWQVNANHVDMAARRPSAAPVDPGEHAAAGDARPEPHRTGDHRHAERLLQRAAAGSITWAPTSRPTARRSRRCSGCCRRCARQRRPVLWVNWGNRPDLANMPPNQLHLYKPDGQGIGLGEPLPGRRAGAAEGQLGGRDGR